MNAPRDLVGAACALGLLLLLPSRASGQCLDWSDAFGLPGLDGTAFASITFDDGSGAAVFVGGDFSFAGGAPARGVALWDGSSFEPLGHGLDGPSSPAAYSFAVHDDGAGPALFVGGRFQVAGGVPATNIARWDGQAWSPLGAGIDGLVRSLAVYDDGSGLGPCLYAGGAFSSAGGQPAASVARWDGSTWSAVGGGVAGGFHRVYELVVYDDGSGPALYAGGDFTHAGGSAASNIARWDGSAWSALGQGTDAPVWALCVLPHAGGSQLFVGGEFGLAGGAGAAYIARWFRSSWLSFPGFDDAVLELSVHDDGSGPTLYAGGEFLHASGLPASRVARLGPSGWSSLGTGVDHPAGSRVMTLCSFDPGDPGSTALVVGGDFLGAGGLALPGVAAWDGADWSELAGGGGLDVTSEGVNALAVFDDGNGAVLYAGGSFVAAGTALTPQMGLARWDGSGWTALPESPWLFGRPLSMAVFDPGAGPMLYVGWTGSSITCWNGSAWDPSQFIGTHSYFLSSSVEAMVVHDDGTGLALYAGGDFEDGCLPGHGALLRWDGRTCSDVGRPPGALKALLSFDDGTGPALLAGGGRAWPASPGFVSRWDGVAWSQLGGEPGGIVRALAGIDDGFGPALYAAGGFGVARWDGAGWVPIGGTSIASLHVHDDGTGPALYAAGAFTSIGQVPANGIARWDGASWTALGLGLEGWLYSGVNTLASFDDGSGPRLWAGGDFDHAGGKRSVGIARWGEDCGCTGTVYCTAKASSLGCVPAMGVSGVTNLSATQPLMLFASQVVSNKPGLLCYGTSGADTKPFLGGTLCVRTPLSRTPVQYSGGNPPPDDCSGQFALEFKSYVLSGADPQLGPGVSVSAQYWYRDPGDPFGVGMTDAVAFTLCP